MQSVLSKNDIEVIAGNAPHWKDAIGNMQVAVFVMAGGGMLGRLAAEQPADFYIDARVSRRPYGIKKIMTAVQTLAIIAQANGLDPHSMPCMPRLHNLRVF